MRYRLPMPLRMPLAALALAILSGVAAYGIAAHLHHTAAEARLRAELAWQAARAAQDQLPERIALVRASGALYADLQRRGFIGAERRLDWVSALSRLRDELALDSLTWRLEARQQSPLMAGLGSSTLHLGLTPMDPPRLRSLLDRLAEQSHGVYTVDRCAWWPNERQGRMECVLTWWTWQGQGGAP